MTFLCPACQNTKNIPVQDYLGTAECFTGKQIVSCTACQLKSVFPMPTAAELDTYYSSYWGNHDVDALAPLFEKQAASRYEFLAPLIRKIDPLKILDIGAGFGTIKKHFRASAQYDAVEVDPIAVDILKNQVRTRQIFTTVAEADSNYDLVILSHILEHLSKPVQFLREIKTKMKPSGALFIEVPNKDFLYKERNQPHLLFFDVQTLESIVAKAGYNIIRVDSCGMNISYLAPIYRQRFKLLRKIIKNILPTAAVKRISKKANESSISTLSACTSVYGDERQWLRLAAKVSK